MIAASVGMEVLGPSLQDFVAAALRVGLHLAPAQQLHAPALDMLPTPHSMQSN